MIKLLELNLPILNKGRIIMKRILITLAFIYLFTNTYCQHYYDPIDSAIASIHLSDQDWIICLTIDRAGTHYDPRGNIDSTNPNGTFLLKKINNNCYLQRLNNTINIYDSIICSYTKDSIQQGQTEWFGPYIYKNDSLCVYKIQDQSDHAPFYRMSMRTNQFLYTRDFPEIEVFASSRYDWLTYKNLNEEHNRSTFIYRAFFNLGHLLKKQFKIAILE